MRGQYDTLLLVYITKMLYMVARAIGKGQVGRENEVVGIKITLTPEQMQRLVKIVVPEAVELIRRQKARKQIKYEETT
ncbi:periplasmic component [Paenibacillus popilliae ATCC 14706]|uniref:Periplasmic component n=1 Tax=Paenibacillus popilliae ATCC 14706 TaxID=1212764 RepID=M9LN38_PAEPP|nr:periplasmic component [Paenibacillus popilliae ATCC 14706]